ncbi:MAG: hypothetical protein H0W30_20675, partial [Gemmatimonadaceae bacterium]|nr:hypothetical protein [Gemmatimonadaceae bacterium]
MSSSSGGPLAEGVASARWAELESLLHEALERPPDERANFLDAVCSDPEQRREVEALLSAHERPGRLDALADSLMAPLLASRAKPAANGAALP